ANGLWTVLLSSFVLAQCQVKVMTPSWLVKEFSQNHGRIMGSTATFGAPFYGERVWGRLVYGRSARNHHCTEDDYEIPPLSLMKAGESGYNKIRLINIVMVRRGNCSFTHKVRIAQDTKDAHAVIIIDREDSDFTAESLANIIVADDGYGDGIHIPSVLISKEDGRRLIEAVERPQVQVVVELAWDLPTDQVVTMDMWMSSASIESNKFLKEFAPKRRVLNEVMIFNPHYAVFSMEKGNPEVYSGVCLGNEPRFCAEDPDGAGSVTGEEVLMEDVRQLCIHDRTKVKRSSLEDLMSGKHLVEYAAKYWDYMEKFLDRCPLDGTGSAKFGIECSEKVMREDIATRTGQSSFLAGSAHEASIDLCHGLHLSSLVDMESWEFPTELDEFLEFCVEEHNGDFDEISREFLEVASGLDEQLAGRAEEAFSAPSLRQRYLQLHPEADGAAGAAGAVAPPSVTATELTEADHEESNDAADAADADVADWKHAQNEDAPSQFSVLTDSLQ
ncbi:unnamed protein product, partial [Cladocopium goreaui]